MDSEKHQKPRVVVLGLDGFTWKILDYLKNEIQFKNLEKLRNDSAWGVLESTIPMNTVPAWISLATGCNPGKHGVFDFVKPVGDLSKLDVVSSYDVKTDMIHQILERKNMKSVIVNLPCATPALTKDITIGSMISAKKDMASPQSIADIPEVSEFFNRRRDGVFTVDDRGYVLDTVIETIKKRSCMAKRLYKEDWDFFFLMFSESDVLHHIFFKEIKSGEMGSSKEKIIEAYQELDEIVGWFIENKDENSYVIVVSDHGFDAYDKMFCLKNFLLENGFLKYFKAGKDQAVRRKNKATRSEKIDLNVAPIINLMYSNSASKKILDLISTAYVKISLIIPINTIFRIKGYRKKVNALESLAMPITVDGYGIYLNKKSRYETGLLDQKEEQEIKNRIIALLTNEKSPLTRRNTFKWAKSSDEIYSGEYVSKGPDILIGLDEHAIIGDGHFSGTYYRDDKNYHEPQGIFAIHGPGIEHGKFLEKKIIDIAPTILHLLGLEIPSNVDGKVISEAFADPRLKQVRIGDSKVMESLKDKIKKIKKKTTFELRVKSNSQK